MKLASAVGERTLNPKIFKSRWGSQICIEVARHQQCVYSWVPHSLFYSSAHNLTPWRNGSASDSRSEGCVFESRRGQLDFCSPKQHTNIPGKRNFYFTCSWWVKNTTKLTPSSTRMYSFFWLPIIHLTLNLPRPPPLHPIKTGLVISAFNFYFGNAYKI